MSIALHGLLVATVWFVVCCLFALGVCVVQMSRVIREVVREVLHDGDDQ